jgi:pyridoxal phosphate enzyme (YggS family)
MQSTSRDARSGLVIIDARSDRSATERANAMTITGGKNGDGRIRCRGTHSHMPSDVAINIAKVRERIRQACAKSGRRESEITLLAVSKTRGADAIRAAFATGATDFGENYCQEALEKIAALADLRLCWHFIGPLQSNKTRAVAHHFDWVHSVDRLKIAQRLAEQRPPELSPLNICIQVNIDAEPTKAGVLPAELPTLMAQVMAMPQLRVRGLMAIPEAAVDSAARRASFTHLRELLAAEQTYWPQLDTLSMGMSADLELAIAEGATIVRVGTDIFGARGAPV